MKNSNDIWKWALVFVLLAVFLITANQAYIQMTKQEDFAPPEDYLQGDSWDIEHKMGPGAGQAMQLSPDAQISDMPIIPQTDEDELELDLEHKEDIDWNQIENPTGD